MLLLIKPAIKSKSRSIDLKGVALIKNNREQIKCQNKKTDPIEGRFWFNIRLIFFKTIGYSFEKYPCLSGIKRI